MKKFKYILLLLAMIQSAAYSQTVFKDYIDGEIYVRIKTGYYMPDSIREVNWKNKLPEMQNIISAYNVKRIEASFFFSDNDKLKRTLRFHFSNTRDVESLIRQLENENYVEYAEKIPLMTIDYTPNDLQPATGAPNQYYLHQIQAVQAWDVTRGNPNSRIAVVDNGIDVNHPDLAGQVLIQTDVADGDGDPTPPNTNNNWEHGTHCAGIACANTNNGTGISGIGFNCKLIAVKATGNAQNGGFTYYGYEGIAFAKIFLAQVISCSWGGTSIAQTEKDVLDDAYNANCIVVAAAGNYSSNTIRYPAGYTNVIAVGNIMSNNQLNSGSNYGSWVDLCAYGTSIYSTVTNGQADIYDYKTGTSMAAPLVAGVLGLIRSFNPQGFNYNAINCLLSTCDNIDAFNPSYVGSLGAGCVNVFSAVECAIPCYGSLNLGTGGGLNPKYESSSVITSSNTINVNDYVVLDAASEIIFQNNFIAYNGSNLRAFIDGCGNLRTANPANNDNYESEAAIILKDDALFLFPNPANDFIIAKINDADTKTTFKIYNSTIQLIKTFNFENGIENKISTADLSSGLYFVDAQSEGKSYKAKFIVSR